MKNHEPNEPRGWPEAFASAVKDIAEAAAVIGFVWLALHYLARVS
ncbi:MAG: hypothetical protein RLZZ127_51 [Planctomycetota bacterium]|jgi:hypothetical protein